MPSGNEHTGAIFVPRTIDAVERTTRTLVARWAAPVRAIGLRALGLADRLLGHHWVLGAQSRTLVRDEVSGELQVLPLPWYEEASNDEALGGKGQRQRTPAGRSSRGSERRLESSSGSAMGAAIAQAVQRDASAGQGIVAAAAPPRATLENAPEMVPLVATRGDAGPQIVLGAGAPAAPEGSASAPMMPAPADPTRTMPASNERPAGEGSAPVGPRQDATPARQPPPASVRTEMPRSQRAADGLSPEREALVQLAESGGQARSVAGSEMIGTAAFSGASETDRGAALTGVDERGAPGEWSGPAQDATGTAAVEGADARLVKEWVREMGGVHPSPQAAGLPAVFRAGAEVELSPSAALRRVYDHMAWVDGRLARHGARHETQAVAEFAWVTGEREAAAGSGERRRSPGAEGIALPLPALDARPPVDDVARSAISLGASAGAETGRGEAASGALAAPQRGVESAFTPDLARIGVAGGLESPTSGGVLSGTRDAGLGQAADALGRGDAERPMDVALSNASSGAASWQAPAARGQGDDAAGAGPAGAGGVYARDLSSALSSVIAPSGSPPAESARPGAPRLAGGASALRSPSGRGGQEVGARAPANDREESKPEGTRPSEGSAGVTPRPGWGSAGGSDVALPDLRFATALTPEEREGASGGVLHFVDRLIGVRAGRDARPLPVAAPLASALDAFREQVLIDLSSTRSGAQAAVRGGPRGESGLARSRPEGAEMAASIERRGGLSMGADGGTGERERPAPTRGTRLSRQEPPLMETVVPAGAGSGGEPPEATTKTAPGAASGMNQAVPEVSEAGLGLGAIGRRAEQLGGLIGIRAAGLAVDFIDPETFSGTSEAHWDVWQMPMLAGTAAGPDAGYAVSPMEDASLLRGSAEGVPRIAQEIRQGSREQGDAGGDNESESGRRGGGSMAPGGIPDRTAMGAEAWAWNREEAWALTRVFPAAAGAIPSYLRDETSGPGRGSIVRAGSVPGGLGAGERWMMPSATGAAEGGWRLGRQVGTHRATESGILGEVVYVAPEVIRDLGRASLPGGRVPRGGYLWSRAAEFARDFGTWELPDTVMAATGAAEAAMSGLPSWQGMAAIETPMVRTALTGSESMAEGDGGSDGVSRDTLSRPSPRIGRQPVPSLQLLEGGANAHDARRGSVGRRFLPPELELVQPSTASAVPANDASARMIEVMQRPRAAATGGSAWSGGSDRISLSDLTLVAVAAATQQVAASTSSASVSPSPQNGGGRGGHKGGEGSRASQRTPAEEHQEIESLAQRVLSEVEWFMDAMRERMGEL